MENSTSDIQIKTEIKKFDRIALWVLISGVILLIITPYLLTKNYIWSGLDFTKTGNIGSTIGGITAPFMSLIGSILVYLSFRMQSKMNAIQFEALEKQHAKIEEESKERNFNKILENI